MRNLHIVKNMAVVATASALALVTTTGKASAITFNLTSTSTVASSSIGFTSGGINLTASPVFLPVVQSPVVNPRQNVVQNGNGLGVRTETPTGFITLPDNTDQIDGLVPQEGLRLLFDQAVRITSVTFTNVKSSITIPPTRFTPAIVIPANDRYRLLAGTQQIATGVIPGGNSTDTGTGTINFNASLPYSTQYTFTASQFLTATSATNPIDDYRISSLDVEPVPEPITMAGLALGSGFGVLLRKKYKKSATV